MAISVDQTFLQAKLKKQERQSVDFSLKISVRNPKLGSSSRSILSTSRRQSNWSSNSSSSSSSEAENDTKKNDNQ